MKNLSKAVSTLLLLALVAGPAWARSEAQFSRLVVFGDSLSDPGNVFAWTGRQLVPPYAELIASGGIPDAPYATGGHHFSNGPTWVEQLSRALRLGRDVRPALRVNGARNYAFAGAHAAGSDNPFDLAEQVDLFLAGDGAALLEDALVVIFVGGNDLREVLETENTDLIGAAVWAVAGLEDNDLMLPAGQIQRLYEYGARRFLVANVPNLGLSPAIQLAGAGGVATALSMALNGALDLQLNTVREKLDGIQVVRFDTFGALNTAIGEQRFSNYTDSCVTPNRPPYRCQDATGHLFWDGIHPTRTGHEVLKQAALAALAAASPPLVQ